MNALTEIQPPSQSSAFSALMLELAKCLKLVAPITMSADAQMVWLQAAVDALDGINAQEVAAISAELRRSVTRPSQIVPEIAKLVHDKRQRANRPQQSTSPFFAEREISRESQARRAKARTQREVEEAWAWERSARADAGLFVPPIEKPLSAHEIEAMPAHIRNFGLQSGFLKRAGAIVEVLEPEETDRIRELHRKSQPNTAAGGR